MLTSLPRKTARRSTGEPSSRARPTKRPHISGWTSSDLPKPWPFLNVMDSRHTRRLTHHSRGATPRYGIHGTAMRNAAAIALAGLASLLMTQAVHAGDRGPAALAAVQIATAGNGHGAPACAACHGP